MFTAEDIGKQCFDYFDRSWDNVQAPEPATTKIAKLWRRQYLANINKYSTRNNPAASYPGLL